MPTFDTPEPITATIEILTGDVRISASDRADTVVHVRPTDESRELDIRDAEQTRVEYAAGRLLVVAPKPHALSIFGKPGSIDVTIELPTGSRLRSDAAMAAFHATGRLGECHVKTALGELDFGETGALDLNTGAGSIAVNRVAGPAEISTGSGRVQLGEIAGTAAIKNSNGDTWIGAVAGDLRVKAANGAIAAGRAGAGVTATSANGDIRIGDLTRGLASLKTGFGEIEIGIHPGTAARLDVSTQFGYVRNLMDPAMSPGPSDEIAEVRARTSYGDIVIRRAGAPGPVSPSAHASRKEEER
jgi:Putative adhesin